MERFTLRSVELNRLDPMLLGYRAAAREPRRIVVELEPDLFEKLDQASGRFGPAGYLKLLALRVIATADSGAEPHRNGVAH
jgi:hypothetical protein